MEEALSWVQREGGGVRRVRKEELPPDQRGRK